MFKPLSSVADVACILSAVYMCYGEVFYQNGCNRCMDRNGLGYTEAKLSLISYTVS